MNGHQDQARIQQGDVAEQAEGIVLAGGQEDGREETAQHAEDGNHHGVKANGQEEGRGGDQHHQQEGWNRSEELEVVNRPARKGHRIENDHARPAQGVCQNGILPP